MSRYGQSTTSKYKTTDPIYQTFDKEEVDAGLLTGEFILMEKTQHAKVDGQLVGRQDRRFMPSSKQKEKEAQGWVKVELSLSDKVAAAPSPKKAVGGGKTAPAATDKLKAE